MQGRRFGISLCDIATVRRILRLFLLAGPRKRRVAVSGCCRYETTSTLLAFAVYAMCTHADVEARVLAEVDAWGKDKPISCIDDLNQVRRP